MIANLRQLFPSKLPQTVDQLSEFIDDVLYVNGIPDDPTYKHAIAAAIMHLGPLTTHKSKRFFAKSVTKQIANQVAFDKIQQIKEEEKAKAMAQQEATQVEVPTSAPVIEVPLDGPSVQTAPGPLVPEA